jgi:hypothetical protein
LQVTCDTRRVTCDTRRVTCDTLRVICDIPRVICCHHMTCDTLSSWHHRIFPFLSFYHITRKMSIRIFSRMDSMLEQQNDKKWLVCVSEWLLFFPSLIIFRMRKYWLKAQIFNKTIENDEYIVWVVYSTRQEESINYILFFTWRQSFVIKYNIKCTVKTICQATNKK